MTTYIPIKMKFALTPLQNQQSNTTTGVEKGRIKEPFQKRIVIVDDDPDITFTYKTRLELYYDDYNNKIRFEIYTYNNPLAALSEFKPNFYDLLLTDTNMPNMNGLGLFQNILELDVNVRVCFMSAGEANVEALREICSKISMGWFIKKPVESIVRLLSYADGVPQSVAKISSP